ncbi:PspA/IM30 family protein [Rhodoplanes roseus]|uniref:PspA family regulator n=1 Tax=Rhodoplanes roseus TaxID=29409 RepID=A0A327KT90_9BRAD|nr:PspA/IM30 family protein [Rhodoplanes roseus]RAI41236.1 hypothetical protein CH341_22105 [Rhodoplanes roseus]
MAESIFLRVRRLVSASIEDAVDAMERAGGSGVMREAIREVDRAVDEVRAEQEAAASRRLQAIRHQRLLREKHAELDEKARFAIAENRDDLAEAAVARQLDLEQEATRLQATEADAAAEAGRLDECLAALAGRKARMEEALAVFEAAHREAATGGDGPGRPDRATERRVERAEAAFDRAMAASGGVAGADRVDPGVGAKVAEIATLQRAAAISVRVAALKAARAAG